MKPLAVLDMPLQGTHLIEASAGTGKTYTIATLALRLVLEAELAVEEILVVTYTRAATAELRTRIRRRLREALAAFTSDEPGQDALLAELVARRRETQAADCVRLEQAIADFDQAAVLTIHGFCQRVLHENAFESGAAYDTELVADLAPLVRELVQDFWVRRLVDAPPQVAAYAYAQLELDGYVGLTGLVYRILSQPEVRVLPAEGPTLEEAVAGWESARVLALELFDPDVATVALEPQKRLAQSWLEQLQAILESPVPGLPTSKGGVDEERFRKLCTGAHPFLQACAALFEAHQQLLLARARLAAELVDYARAELGRRKSDRRVRSYDDLLVQVRDGLAAGPGLGERLRDRYRVALIDEFQDTDPVQYQIFKQAFHDAGRPLFLIGDPKQAIYGFRGGDVFTYLEARDAAGERQWTLDTSWRSDPGLVHGLNTFFQRPAAPFVVPDIAYQPVQAAPHARDRLGGAGAPLTLLAWPADEPTGSIPQRVAAHLCGLRARGAMIGDRPLEAGDVAILARTNKQSMEMQQALRDVGVPSVLLGDHSVLDSPEAEELERLLAAAADPGNRGGLRAAITTSFYGESGDRLIEAAEAPERWAAWRDDFREWHSQWHEHGFMPAFRQAVESRGVPERLLSLPDGERRLTNLYHLAELLHAAERERHLGPEGLVYWLRELRGDSEARGDVAPEAMQVRLESDARAVKLLTVHKAKGLEYPVVYCPFLCGEELLRQADRAWLRFHDDEHRATLDLRGRRAAPHLARARYEASAEQARLLYVALTRARHACYVVWGKFRNAAESGLALALHGAMPVGGDPVEAHEQARARLKLAFDKDSDPSGELHELAARSGGSIAVEALVAVSGARWPAPPAVERPLAARGLPPMPPVLRKSSFSEMIQHSTPHRAPSIPVESGLDVDAAPLEPDGTPVVMSGPLTLADLPSGARTGTLLHAVLEEVDFAREKRGEARAVVAQLVARFGYDAKWVDPITRSLDDVLDTPIGEVTSRPGKGRGRSGWTLADVPPAKRLAELEFFLPVAQEGTALTAARLSKALTDHGGLLWAPYAARVKALRFEALAGYLQGFIDLVFEEDGRYWVVDYKSNRLGSRPDDYRVERLEQSMQDGHYVLQYLLYLVAVHRHLRARLPKYSAAKQLGGALYLFVRGMSPSRGMHTGVYFARPPVALIEALDRVLEGQS